MASKDYVRELSSFPPDIQELINDPPSPDYFIPWRFVYKESSISTPIRIVFDASSVTPGGESLNSCLAKGENRLMKISHLLMRFRTGAAAFAADIKMAYNNLALDPIHYRFQKFLWKHGLDPSNPIIVMIVCTLIYGVKPVGNQLQGGFVNVGDHCIEHFPEHTEGALSVIKDSYVDDLLRAARNLLAAKQIAESVRFTLSLAGMSCKAFTFSGEPPPPEVSSDGLSVGLIGMIWEPEKDVIGIDIKDLYLGKAKRGKLPALVTGDVMTALSKRFTKRILLGKTAGVFDPLGLLTPVTCKLKLDMQIITELKTDWDEKLPDKYLMDWVENLDMIQRLKEVRFRRTIIPADAASDTVDLIVSSDASQNIAITCIHARVRLRSGEYSVQLLTAKSKLVRYKTIPKGEIRAAVMGASLGHVAKTNLGSKYGDSIYVTDSTVALHWIAQDERPLETLVRNAVIEIRRFTAVGQWFHISTELNPADLGTRPATVEEIMLDSEWQLGKEWMGMNYEDMPLKTIEDINLTSEAKRQASQEEKHADLFGVNLPELRHRVAERYDQFHYLYDPNRYGWIRATRVMGYVIKFIKVKLPNYEPCWKPPLPLAEAEQPELERLQKYGEYYYYFKCTQEVKLFSNPKDYKNSYVEKGSIYFYTGRILQGQGVDTPVDNFFDVQPLDFVRPLMDRWSPVAYSIMVHVHTSISHHRNANVTLRESRTIAYVLRGRDLAIEISENCRFCTRFKAKTLEVEMGNLHQSRLTIAPPFYHVQIDLFGPVTMVCEHNHRSTIKSYGAVYKDPASTSIAAFAMPGYSTAAFLTTYTRFASRYGHPTKVLIDEGSQLLSACRNMEISIQDIKNHVNSTLQIGVDFETAPVQGHNVTGMVERSIKEVKGLLEKLFGGRKLDLLTFETCLAFVCNELNNFPICIGSKTEHLGNVDIITPNRLLLGRNNRRSLGGFVKLKPHLECSISNRIFTSCGGICGTRNYSLTLFLGLSTGQLTTTS